MGKNDLTQYQQESFQILLEFERVCRALGLRWYLTAGTLLGAVRHSGFIPWDDDIDVTMPREDYDRLARLAPEALPPGFLFQDGRSEPLFFGYFGKIRRLGTYVNERIFQGVPIEQGYYIDIFPLDACPEDSRAAAAFFKCMKLLTCAIMGRTCPNFVCQYQKRCARLLWQALRRLPLRWLHALRDLLRKAVGRFSSGNRLCTVDGRHGCPRETYRAEWFRDTVLLPFEGRTFPAPAGWEALLRSMYGDYRTPPPEEERQGHFV